MARFQVTIAQPNGSTPAIPPVVLENFGTEGYRRSDLQMISVNSFSGAGAAIVDGAGAVYLNRYTWSLSSEMQELDALRLEALIRWQDGKYQGSTAGHLLLTDEVEYLAPEPSPHSKTLLSSISFPSTTLVYGFGVFKVKLAIPGEGHRSHRGLWGTGQLAKTVQIQAVELPTE